MWDGFKFIVEFDWLMDIGIKLVVEKLDEEYVFLFVWGVLIVEEIEVLLCLKLE